jgi:hypothetical protein
MTLLAVFLVVHGAIHALGAAKAFGWAELPQLTEPISPSVGGLWLLASLLFLLTAGSLYVWPRGWWAIGFCAIGLSMAVIVSSWGDAKAGALANVIVLAAVTFGAFRQWPQ